MISSNFDDYTIKGTKDYSTPDGRSCLDISYQNKRGFGFCVSVSRACFFDEEIGQVRTATYCSICKQNAAQRLLGIKGRWLTEKEKIKYNDLIYKLKENAKKFALTRGSQKIKNPSYQCTQIYSGRE